LQAFKYLAGFPANVFQLTIGKLRQVGHEHLAVVRQVQIGGPRAAANWSFLTEALGAIRRYRACGAAAASKARRIY
jgi:hypothetical protein